MPDDVADLAAARGDAGYGGDMVGLERVLHPEQKAEPQNSEHAPPALRRTIKYQVEAIVRPTLQRVAFPGLRSGNFTPV